MSAVLQIEEIANGWLIHSDDPDGAYYLPDLDAVQRRLPEKMDEAMARANPLATVWPAPSTRFERI